MLPKGIIVKILVTVICGLATIITCAIIINQKANKIDKKEADYYHDNKCLPDYIQVAYDEFYEKFLWLGTQAGIVVACAVL